MVDSKNNDKGNMVEIRRGSGKVEVVDPEERTKFICYLTKGEEGKIRDAAWKAGITNQFGEGNISGVLSYMAQLSDDELQTLMEYWRGRFR